MAYFPNHSSSGVLESQCEECPVSNDAPCPILGVQITFNYDQIGSDKMEELMNWLIDKDGICQMKPILESHLDNKCDCKKLDSRIKNQQIEIDKLRAGQTVMDF